jgi:hypothetical protein
MDVLSQSYFGAVPPQVLENLLWFFTEHGDTVVDLRDRRGTASRPAIHHEVFDRAFCLVMSERCSGTRVSDCVMVVVRRLPSPRVKDSIFACCGHQFTAGLLRFA